MALTDLVTEVTIKDKSDNVNTKQIGVYAENVLYKVNGTYQQNVLSNRIVPIEAGNPLYGIRVNNGIQIKDNGAEIRAYQVYFPASSYNSEDYYSCGIAYYCTSINGKRYMINRQVLKGRTSEDDKDIDPVIDKLVANAGDEEIVIGTDNILTNIKGKKAFMNCSLYVNGKAETHGNTDIYGNLFVGTQNGGHDNDTFGVVIESAVKTEKVRGHGDYNNSVANHPYNAHERKQIRRMYNNEINDNFGGIEFGYDNLLIKGPTSAGKYNVYSIEEYIIALINLAVKNAYLEDDYKRSKIIDKDNVQ